MRRILIIKENNGEYKIPKFLKFKVYFYNFKLEYNGNLYDKEIRCNKNVRQVSLLVEALKNRKSRLKYIYEKSCDLLDEDFYGKNICKFKNNKCFVNRMHECSLDGFCRSKDNKSACEFLIKHKCTIRNLACKLHVCSYLKKGYKFNVNDIYEFI